MEMAPNLHSQPHDPLRGVRLILMYVAVVVTIAVVLTILQPGGPL